MSEHDDTAWFERLYAAAESGEAEVPWDRGGPNPFLEQWVRDRGLDGTGRRALVIGTVLGDDAELLAARGFSVTAFDVAPTAIEGARRRFPGSSVEYRVADLLDLPPDLVGAFDLVAECITVQAPPLTLRSQAIDAIASTVAPGGTLVVVSGIHSGDGPRPGPPWELTRGPLARRIHRETKILPPWREVSQVRSPKAAARASAAAGRARISARTAAAARA